MLYVITNNEKNSATKNVNSVCKQTTRTFIRSECG